MTARILFVDDEPRVLDSLRRMLYAQRGEWKMTFEEQPALPYVRCGRLLRYCPDDLKHWVDCQRKGGRHDTR